MSELPYLEQMDPPNTIKVEMSTGCNLRCSMCGIASIQEKQGRDYRFMQIETAEKIAKAVKRTGWNSKFEFTLRGEPLMNPNAKEIIHTFREHLPRAQLMVTSNAIPLLRPPGVEQNIRDLFDAGLNILALDDYRPSKKATDEVRRLAGEDMPWQTEDFKTGNTKTSPYHRGSRNRRIVIIIEDFEQASKDRRHVGVKFVNNHSGCGSPPTPEPIKYRCARPFREMIFRSDGRVALCCNEWRDYFRIDSILTPKGTLNVEATWNAPELMAARKKLMNRDRSFAPCKGCDVRTTRDGLLPDRMGKMQMAPLTDEERKALRRASNRGPQETPVLRPWEK